MRLFQVDAFTQRRFHGNPAAVVPLPAFPDDDVLQAIAAENNLSETAFYVPHEGDAADFRLRWFTPTVEVDLCGHATLATGHVLWTEMGFGLERITFETRSGVLSVEKASDRYRLDFPALPGSPIDPDNRLVATLATALGRQPEAVLSAPDLLCVFENKREVHELAPDPRGVAALCGETYRGVIVTAPGAGHDFVSRFFAPAAGVDEDPVTGSAHCTLAPYWADRLGRDHLTAHQVSRRGGELWCTYERERGRVLLSGHAVTYLRGEIEV